MNMVGDFAKELASQIAGNVVNMMAGSIPELPLAYNDSIMTLDDVESTIKATIVSMPGLAMHRFKGDRLRVLQEGAGFFTKDMDTYIMAVRFITDGRDHFSHHLTPAGTTRHHLARQALGRLRSTLDTSKLVYGRYTNYLKIIDDLVATGRCRVWDAQTNFTSEYVSEITTFITGDDEDPDLFSVAFSDDSNNFDIPTPVGRGMQAGNYLILRDAGGRLKRITKFDKTDHEKELIEIEFTYGLNRSDLFGEGRPMKDPLIPEVICDHLDIHEWITRLESLEVSTLRTSIMYNCVDTQDNVINVTVTY